ncbi:hypothetical protein AMK22_31565 [Streptomyces sp. CB01580]|nr:hypothetical protein AMK22_31565 [Streptomyces sp. CB01580]
MEMQRLIPGLHVAEFTDCEVCAILESSPPGPPDASVCPPVPGLQPDHGRSRPLISASVRARSKTMTSLMPPGK